ncbi:MAG: phosphate transport system protein, partial [Solirubrobacteraceae bacterium]|nr:phosphate transport system protein [Solirubrobacteraceae bacterium]
MSSTRQGFQRDLSELQDLTLGALDLVLTLLDRVIEALEYQDVELALHVIADDARVDDRCTEIQQRVIALLALQGPVAGDLRLLAALLHVARYVERMGNQCVSVASLIPLS